MLRIVLFLLVVSVSAMAAVPYAVLNDAEPGPSTIHAPNFKDGWLDPSNDTFYNGIALLAAYTEAWPSFNATFFNYIDLPFFGESAPLDVEQLEVAIMNKFGSDGVGDLIVLPDDGNGYPDIANYYDVQEDVGIGSWISGTYPNAHWNNYTYPTPVRVPDGDIFWIGFHMYWPTTFNFYNAFNYVPASGGNAFYDAIMVYVQDNFLTFGEMGYGEGAWNMRCYATATGVESASLGEIKAAFK